MNSETRISANTAPADAVLPQAADAGFIGVVMLDTSFPRPPGDIGHPDSFGGLPVKFAKVRGAWPAQVVANTAGLRKARAVTPFQAIVRQLERDGAVVITTSCGFLVLLQKELQSATKVPVVTSSLLQLAGLLEREPQVGVLTISARDLGAEHLRAAGVRRERLSDVIVQGVDPKSEFATAILGNRPDMDLMQAQQDVVNAALALKARAPSVRMVVLECTNMPPYAAAIKAATGFELRSLQDDERLRRPFQAATVLEPSPSPDR